MIPAFTMKGPAQLSEQHGLLKSTVSFGGCCVIKAYKCAWFEISRILQQQSTSNSLMENDPSSRCSINVLMQWELCGILLIFFFFNRGMVFFHSRLGECTANGSK